MGCNQSRPDVDDPRVLAGPDGDDVDLASLHDGVEDEADPGAGGGSYIGSLSKVPATGANRGRPGKGKLERGLSSKPLQPVKAARHFKKHYSIAKDQRGKDISLGVGNYAEVFECIEKATGRHFAVKCLKDKQLQSDDKEGLAVEISLLRQLRHENIISLQDYFLDGGVHYVIVDLLQGGELFAQIIEQERYSEVDGRRVVRTMLSVLDYMHDRGIVHRDLKPENIMLDESDPKSGGTIKLIDFGFAQKLGREEDGADPFLHTACGTPQYVAPEIVPADIHETPSYGPPVDVWALGVITYILLCGYPPFMATDEQGRGGDAALFRAIRAGDYCFYADDWTHVSDTARDFIRKALLVDPNLRWTVKQLLEHPWFDADNKAVSTDNNLSSAQAKLKKYLARKRLKKGIAAVVAVTRMKKLLGAVRSAAAADGAGDGGDGGDGGPATRFVDLTKLDAEDGEQEEGKEEAVAPEGVRPKLVGE